MDSYTVPCNQGKRSQKLAIKYNDSSVVCRIWLRRIKLRWCFRNCIHLIMKYQKLKMNLMEARELIRQMMVEFL
jgi:hypothetical protein